MMCRGQKCYPEMGLGTQRCKDHQERFLALMGKRNQATMAAAEGSGGGGGNNVVGMLSFLSVKR
jgi:hypothetical protein